METTTGPRHQQIVIIMVGFPGCGKTTWANFHYPNFTRIDGDSLKTSPKVAKALAAALNAGQNAIVDATNLSLSRRSDLFKVIQQRKSYLQSGGYPVELKTYGVVFKYSIETCTRRSQQRENQQRVAGIEVKHIPAIAYRKLNSSYVEPTLAEGFDYIGVINEESNQ